MAGVQISRSDVEQLARKLDSLGSHFTESEWSMLSAVLAVAAEATGTAGADPADPGAAGAGQQPAAPLGSFSPGKDEEDDDFAPDKIGRASLQDQVLRSFTPGEDEEEPASGQGKGADPGPDKIGRA